MGAFLPKHQAYFARDSCMPGAGFILSYRPYMKEAYVDREPNFHTEEEYLCFIATIWSTPSAHLTPR
jgi:hypothetical protein